ncbi:hypothetical protein KJZ63_02135 [Patescibacteria group bacterium]|nr:hypothetical protein [Patescibacteria group bacterium]
MFGEQTKRGKKFGGKAENLSLLVANGIPVPEAQVISTESFTEFKRTGQIGQELILTLEKVRQNFGGKIALRSSATCEDGDRLSMSGVFETFYLDEDHSIEDCLHKIYEQAQSQTVQDYLALHDLSGEQVEMAVVVQKLIEPDVAGVIYTGVEGNLLIQYASGFGSNLVDGVVEGASIVYSPNEDKLIKSKNSDLLKISSEKLRELATLASKICKIFPNSAQDIEFAIEGDNIHILQARTLTAEADGFDLEMSETEIVNYIKEQIRQIVDKEKAELGTTNVILSDSNFSELLPHPKEMDFGVFAHIFTGRNGQAGAIQLGRKQMGYPLGEESVGYMDYVGGKPYFSIAKDAHTFYAGFPATKDEYTQTFVEEYLASINEHPERGEYPEMGLYVQDPSLEELVNRFGEVAGQQYFQVYLNFKETMKKQAELFLPEYLLNQKSAIDSFIVHHEAIDFSQLTTEELGKQAMEILEHLRTVSCVQFVKSARLGFYFSQRLQTLLKDNFGFNEDEVTSMFAKLNQGLDDSEITNANLKIAQSSSLDEALEVGKRLVGHYSTGEMLEIRHPRLKDDEVALGQYVGGIFSSGSQYVQEFERQKSDRQEVEIKLKERLVGNTEVSGEFTRVLEASQTYMSLRETVKYQFVKEYAILRDILVELANKLEMPAEDIFSLYPEEILDLVQNPTHFPALIAERQERFGKYSLLDLPSVIRESDIDLIGEAESSEQIANLELLGKFLAGGKALAEAIIVNLEDFETVEAAREVLLFYRNQALPIVLVASQMNLSHDPLIVQADGLVIENAGLVSHGAQRARELGRGAIGGIKAKKLKTGERVSFNPSLKKIIKNS